MMRFNKTFECERVSNSIQTSLARRLFQHQTAIVSDGERVSRQGQQLRALSSTSLAIVKGSWTVPRNLNREAHPAGPIGAAAAHGMSKPTPIVLFLVGVGLGLFGLRIFGIEWLQYKWVLAISIGLVAYGAYLYVIAERQNLNLDSAQT